VVLAVAAGRDSFRALAHLARCAWAILRREACEIMRVGWVVCCTVPVAERSPTKLPTRDV
jgi:hypothetical protein